METVTIGPYTIGAGHRPLVVAEAGINHNGNLDVAIEMVRAAKQVGVDIIKFQTHIAEAEMLPDRTIGEEAGAHVNRSLFDIMSECYLSFDDHIMLKREAEQLGILFLSTPFSVEAVELLEQVGVLAYKIGSGEVTNLPFLKYIAEKRKPVILSTGTANWNEVCSAVHAVKRNVPGLILLQCTSNYPTPYKDVNLGVMDRMRKEFRIPVGLSDHCTGNYACFAAVARGACIVEKHFTLSRLLPGIDQKSSIEPYELKDLVTGVRAIAESLGDEKKLNEEALRVRHGFSESVVTLSPVKKGEEFRERINVWVKRPGSGIPSYELPNIVGKRAARDLPADYLITYDDIAS